VYAPTPANPSPTKNAPDIAKSIFQRIFIALDFSCAWVSAAVQDLAEPRSYNPRVQFQASRRDGYRLWRMGTARLRDGVLQLAYVFVPGSELERVCAMLGALGDLSATSS
jgi:hypothetical protein